MGYKRLRAVPNMAESVHSPAVRGHWGFLLLSPSLLQGLPVIVSLENHSLSSFVHAVLRTGRTSSFLCHVQKAYLPQGPGQTPLPSSPKKPAGVTQL